MSTTLEEPIEATDFKVVTLNDLLETDARNGVAVGGDEDKYRKWAFVSTAAAGLLAVMLVVAVVTGGGGDGGGGGGGQAQKSIEAPEGTIAVPLSFATGKLPDGAKVGDIFSVTSSEDGSVLANGATLISSKEVEVGGGFKQVQIQLAVTPAERTAMTTTDEKEMTVLSGPLEVTTETTAPAPAAEAPAPPEAEAPVPVDQAPAEAPPS